MADVNLTTAAEIRKVIDGLNRIERKMDDVTQNNKKMERATQQSGRQFNQFASTAAKVAGTLGAMELLRREAEMIQLGAAAMRMGDSLNAISDGQADQFIEAIGEASLGTINNMDAMTASARALRLGVVQNAEDMEQLTAVAVALGRTMGLDATQALSDLTTGIGRLSPMILDNLGIAINLTDTYAAYADSLGISASEMTKAQQQQAVLNEVLEEGQQTIDQMGGITLDAAGEIEAFRAEIDNAEQAIGVFLASGLLPYIKGMKELIKLQPEVTAENAKSADSAEEFNRAMLNSSVNTQLLIQQLGLSEEAARALGLAVDFATNPALTIMEQRLRDDVAALVEAQQEMSGFTAREHQMAQGANRLESSIAGLTHREAQMAGILDESNQTMEEGAGATAELSEATDDLTDSEQTAAERAEAHRKALEGLLDVQKENASIAEDLVGQFDNFGETVHFVTGRNQQYIDLAGNLRDMQGDLQTKIFETNAAFEAGVISQEQYEGQLSGLQSQLAGVNQELTFAEGNIGGVMQSMTITELDPEQLEMMGNAFLSIVPPAQQAGGAFDDIRKKYGLVTSEQLAIEQGIDSLRTALQTSVVDVEMASEAWDLFITGQVNSMPEAIAQVQDAERWQNQFNDALGVSIENADLTDESLSALQEHSNTTIPNIKRTMDDANEPLEIATDLTGMLADNLQRAKANSRFEIEIGGNIPSVGGGSSGPQSVGGSSGGPSGFASGGRPPVGVPSIVGEEGPELFVPDSAGTIFSNDAMMGMGGQVVNNTNSVTINEVVLPNVTNLDQLERELQARYGVNLAAMGRS